MRIYNRGFTAEQKLYLYVGLGFEKNNSTNCQRKKSSTTPRIASAALDVRSCADPESPPAMDLPEEMLADILRRVPARHLAACRRVCAYWRATIDARRLLLPHLLPGAPRGVFINMAEGLRDT